MRVCVRARVRACVCVRACVWERSCTCCSASEDAVKVCDEVPASGDQSWGLWLVPLNSQPSFCISNYCATPAQLRLISLTSFIDLVIRMKHMKTAERWKVCNGNRCVSKRLPNVRWKHIFITFHTWLCHNNMPYFMSLSVSAERLYNSNGRDLRRALFSLKQIFQVTQRHRHTETHTHARTHTCTHTRTHTRTHTYNHIYFICNYSQFFVAEYSWLLWPVCTSMMTGISINVAFLPLCIYLCHV